MSLESFYYVSQIIASFAVLASLIYLALQTRQTAHNQKTLMHENRIQTISRDTEQIVNNPNFAAVYLRCAEGDVDGVADVDVLRYFYFTRTLLIQWEERFRQRRDGMLDESRWRTTEATVRNFIMAPGSRAVAEDFSETCEKSFAQVLRDLLTEQGPPTQRAIGWAMSFRSIQRWRSRVDQLRSVPSS